MKIRNGFISNSSSSSFIVVETNRKEPEKPFISEEERALLVSYGFKPIDHGYPSRLETQGFPKQELDDDDIEGYGCSVVCNEDEVIEFLLRNQIPFRGSCHYGHRTCIWRRGEEFIYWYANLGIEIETYGEFTLEKLGIQPRLRTIEDAAWKENVKIFLDEQNQWREKCLDIMPDFIS
jgi:hypothetical protein